MPKDPKVSVIILNWNQPELTADCVRSVLKQTYGDFEILLVDNGSGDDSAEIFRKEFSGNEKIRILETGENLGYAGGNNEGVKNSRGEYIAILNNDTIVEKDWLGELVRGLESGEKTGAVSPMETMTGKMEKINFKKEGVTNTLLGSQTRYPYKTPLEKTDIIDIFPLEGSSFIYDKKILNLPFDPEYFIYAEDIYLAWRLNLMGYTNRLARKSIVHHLHHKKNSSRKPNNYFTYLGERNRILNLLLFYEWKNLLRVLPLAFSGIVIINLSEPGKIPHRLKSYLWVLFHPLKIMKKRGCIQKQRVVSDEKIIARMSCRLMDESKVEQPGKRRILSLVNKFFHLYCRLVGLNTLESADF